MSKLTAIGVERVLPNTQRILIIEYLRHVLSAYLRLSVIYAAATKRKPAQVPSISTVAPISLPAWENYYYEDRFLQFRDCVRSVDAREHMSLDQIREHSARKASIELRKIILDTQRFERYLSVFTEYLKNNSEVDVSTNRLLLDTLNKIILRNYTLLSYIDPIKDSMTQCRYYWGRSAILDFMFDLSNELSTMHIEDSRLKVWHSISKEIVDDENLFVYKLIHNEHFNVDEYLKSAAWATLGVKTKKDLTEKMVDLFSRLLCHSSKFYMAKTEKV